MGENLKHRNPVGKKKKNGSETRKKWGWGKWILTIYSEENTLVNYKEGRGILHIQNVTISCLSVHHKEMLNIWRDGYIQIALNSTRCMHAWTHQMVHHTCVELSCLCVI